MQQEMEMEGGTSAAMTTAPNSIAEQIEELRVQMEHMGSFLGESNPAAVSTAGEEQAARIGSMLKSVSERIEKLRDEISKLKPETSPDPVRDGKPDQEKSATGKEDMAELIRQLNEEAVSEMTGRNKAREFVRPNYKLKPLSDADRAAMASEAEEFEEHRRGWKSSFGSDFGRCGGFEEMTTLSSMHFTHLTPGGAAETEGVAERTLQFCSVKISEIKGLEWPIHVYGIVAARDTVDHNRNMLFIRSRGECQTITEKDPFLQLTGPSRAIVFDEPVCFEVQLRLRGRRESEDRMLISDTMYYGLCSHAVPCLVNHFCTVELGIEPLGPSVQATILGVRLVRGESWHSEYGGRVVCSSYWEDDQGQGTGGGADLPSGHAVMLDSRGEPMPMGSNGYLDLSRHVLSVEEEGSLKVLVQAYSESGTIAATGCVYIYPIQIM